MKSDWEERYNESKRAWHELKSFTKRVSFDGQTAEYKQLVNLIHSLGRDEFYWNPDDYEQDPPQEGSENKTSSLSQNALGMAHVRA
jgi:hypothetical protein